MNSLMTTSWRVTLLYMLLSAAWIFFSDRLINALITDPLWITNVQTFKGWGFVAISALALYGMLRYEMSARVRAQNELLKVNRALRTLSECNQVLVRATDEPELLQRICQSIVTVGGYRLAWVGFAEQDQAWTVRPVAQAGYEDGYLDTLQITWADTERGQGPTGVAIRSGQPCVVRDIMNDPAYAPWRAEAIRRGYASSVALPLIAEGQTFGALNIYATELKSFDAKEMRLLVELADDLAYGITALRTSIAHQKAEAQIQFQKTLLECQSEVAPDGILIVSHERTWLSFNQRFVEMWGITEDVVSTRSSKLAVQSVLDKLVDPEQFVTNLQYLYEQEHETSHDEVALKDGRVFERYSAPVQRDGEIHYGRVWYYRDITPRKQAEEALRAAYEQTNTILESITDAFLTLDANWNFAYVNREAERILRRPRAELVGCNVWEAFPDAIGSPFYVAYHQALAQQVATEFEAFYEPLDTWFDVRAYPAKEGLSVYFRDITERKRTEEALLWESRVNASIADLSRTLITSAPLETISGLVLDHAKQLTSSQFGYVGYIDPQTGHLVCPTMTRDIWDTCEIEDKSIVFETFGGLWGWILHNRTSLLTNTPSEDPRSSGTPMGHVPIQRFLSAPAVIGDVLLGQVALANADRPYTPQDLDLIERMAMLYALAVRRHRDEEALRRYAERLQHLHEIDRAILAAHSPPEIAGAVLSRLQQLVTCQHASVTLIDSEAEIALVVATYRDGELKTSTGERVPFDHFHSTPALWQGHMHQIHELPTQAEKTASAEQAQNAGAYAYVGVPLICQETLIGVLTLELDAANTFSPADWEIVHAVADQLAIAIQQARLFEQVRDGRARLQLLSRRLVEVQEIERQHLARELHDEIGQILTGLHLTLEMASRNLGEHQSDIHEARSLVSDLLARVRDLSLDLRPAMLDDLGLLPTLRWHFNRYTSQTDVQVIFKHAGLERRFAPEIETAIYRLVQEALTNVARHARVDEVTVRLWANQASIGVQIEDKGDGFDLGVILMANASRGLAGMRERAALLGGEFTIDSQVGVGTQLSIELPLDATITV